MDNEYRKQLLLIKKENQQITTPLRLQAYERLILFLERIALNNLVLRTHRPGMTGLELKKELIKSVNQEFEHNLVQQIYISSTGWGQVKKAKDDVIKIINLVGTQLSEKDSGKDLAQKIFELVIKSESSPTAAAVSFLKKETRQLF